MQVFKYPMGVFKMTDMFSLKDKVVVITGGHGLLGSQMIMACRRQGATIINFDLDKKKLSESLPEGVYFYCCDISQEDSVSQAVQAVIRDLGRIDVLVNNAYPRNKEWGRVFEEITLRSWCENVDSHLGGYFNVSRQVIREMVKRKSGSVINICSIYGMVGPDFSVYEGTGMTMPAEYAAIKGGLINFTRYLATYFGKHNIRVNAISPGGISNKQDPRFVERYVQKVPLGRMATSEDISGALIFLASDASQYVTGQNIAVDGGWTSW